MTTSDQEDGQAGCFSLLVVGVVGLLVVLLLTFLFSHSILLSLVAGCLFVIVSRAMFGDRRA